MRWCLWSGSLVLLATAAAAGNPGTADSDLMLGPIQTYETEREARAACGPNGVVWAERYAGYYFKPGDQKYGTAPLGSFACEKDMADANYWDTDPMSAVLAPRGRSFPSGFGRWGS